MKDETQLWLNYAEENLQSAKVLLKIIFITPLYKTRNKPSRNS